MFILEGLVGIRLERVISGIEVKYRYEKLIFCIVVYDRGLWILLRGWEYGFCSFVGVY